MIVFYLLYVPDFSRLRSKVRSLTRYRYSFLFVFSLVVLVDRL